jgi:hypothetical protein
MRHKATIQKQTLWFFAVFSTVESILQVIRVQRPFWKCFQYQKNAHSYSQLPPFFQDIEIPKA